MSQNFRREVLRAFKSLHKTRREVFAGDERALRASRQKINEEYKKCKRVKDPSAIEVLVEYSRAVEDELKTTVIQAKEMEPGKYQVRLRDETVKLDNVPFKDCNECKH